MLITDTDIDSLLSGLLQRTFKFVINKRILKEGRVLLYKQINYCIQWTIKSTKDNSVIVFETPIPYDVVIGQKKIILDYTIHALCKGNQRMIENVSVIKPLRRSKYYNNKLILEVMGDV